MNLLFEATVKEFYRQRSGFFLVVLLIAFGTMSAREHQAIALFLLTPPLGMLTLFILWGLYAWLCSTFWKSLWRSPAYLFIYQTRLIPPFRRSIWLSGLTAGFLFPILAYGVFIIATGITAGLTLEVLVVPAVWLLLSAPMILLADWMLKHPDSEIRTQKTPYIPRLNRPKSWIFWTLEWLIRERGLAVLLCKTGALLITAGTLLYYATDEYDLRLPAIGLTLAALMNTGISYQVFFWETNLWHWRRSLPIRISQKIANIVGIHFIVLWPDLLVAIRYGLPLLTIFELFQLFLLQLSVILWYHYLLYGVEGRMEDRVNNVFWVYILLTLLILFKIPVAVLSVGLIAFGAYAYHRYEKLIPETK